MNTEDFYKMVNGDYISTIKRFKTDQQIIHYLEKLASSSILHDIYNSISKCNLKELSNCLSDLKSSASMLGLKELEYQTNIFIKNLNNKFYFVRNIGDFHSEFRLTCDAIKMLLECNKEDVVKDSEKEP